jgi:hypothetical protein
MKENYLARISNLFFRKTTNEDARSYGAAFIAGFVYPPKTGEGVEGDLCEL